MSEGEKKETLTEVTLSESLNEIETNHYERLVRKIGDHILYRYEETTEVPMLDIEDLFNYTNLLIEENSEQKDGIYELKDEISELKGEFERNKEKNKKKLEEAEAAIIENDEIISKYFELQKKHDLLCERLRPIIDGIHAGEIVSVNAAEIEKIIYPHVL